MNEFPAEYLANLNYIANVSPSANNTDPIKTTNQNGEPVTTRKASYETTAGWIDRHFKNVISEWEGNGYSLTNELCTCWFDQQDNPHCICTERNEGESDADFLGRHMVEVTTEMISHPPAP